MKKPNLINLAVKYGAPQKDIVNSKSNQDLVDLIYRRIAINYGAKNDIKLKEKTGEKLIEFVHTLQPVIDCKRSSCFRKKDGSGGKKILNTQPFSHNDEKKSPNMKKTYPNKGETLCSGSGMCIYKCANGYKLSDSSTKFKNIDNVGAITCGQGQSVFSSAGCIPKKCNLNDRINKISNGSFKCSVGSNIIDHGETCDVVCSPGYKINNKANIKYKCLVDDAKGQNIMTKTKGTAICQQINCKVPATDVTKGYLNFPSTLKGGSAQIKNVKCNPPVPAGHHCGHDEHDKKGEVSEAGDKRIV